MTQLKPILLVEDSERDIELTLAALGELRLANEIEVVRDGLEALDFLHGRGKFSGRSHVLPAAVFLDLKMPKPNGLEVLERMKADARLKGVPVVMVTSSREEQDLVRSYELGVNAYVVKPIDFQQFVDSVKALGFFWAVVNELPNKIA